MEAEIFDSHAHYDDARFDEERDTLLATLFANGVTGIVNVGTNPQTIRSTLSLAQTYPALYAAVGFYPHETHHCTDADYLWLETILQHPKVVAIGEIGLDFHYDDAPREVQLAAFDRQMQLAQKTGFPVVIHDREAHGACMDMVRRYPKVQGVFHSYSGSAEMAKELIARGWMISFSGSVTFKNAHHLWEAAQAVPLEAMLLETDAPYLAPVPMRGKTNHSDYIRYTAEKIAQLKDLPTAQVLTACAQNARRFFRLHG